jgi:cytochrome P450
VPFGGGPRICIGQQFALTQMCYFVTRMFQTFKAVEPRDDKEPLLKIGATISLVNGCVVSLTPVDA